MSELPELPRPDVRDLGGVGFVGWSADAMREYARQAVAAERTRAAQVCADLAAMMEDGAGEVEPGGRLRQAARYIEEGRTTCGYDADRKPPQ